MLSRRTLTTLRSKAPDDEDKLPYVKVEEGFARWHDHRPIIHDCIVDVSGLGGLHSFLVSAYYDYTRYPPNPTISRHFGKISPWHGEIAVVFLGKRKFFKQAAQLNYAGKAAAAYVCPTPAL